MSYFSQAKNERDKKIVSLSEAKPVETPAKANAQAQTAAEPVSTLAPGMLITGNIVCVGSVQIFGRVVGDIHAAQLTIAEGAQVDGKVMAQDTVISGAFKGTIHGNTVKLTNTAVVEGEIYKNSLTVDENAQFEGLSRRLERPVEAPPRAAIRGEAPRIVLASADDIVPMPAA